jgi:hypothetical protein
MFHQTTNCPIRLGMRQSVPMDFLFTLPLGPWKSGTYVTYGFGYARAIGKACRCTCSTQTANHTCRDQKRNHPMKFKQCTGADWLRTLTVSALVLIASLDGSNIAVAIVDSGIQSTAPGGKDKSDLNLPGATSSRIVYSRSW